MSGIEGIAELKAKLRRFEDEVAMTIGGDVIAEAQAMQKEWADLVKNFAVLAANPQHES